MIHVSGGQAPGLYSLGLRLPDIEPSLHDDVRYAIRFANKNIWVPETGVNLLVKDLKLD
jgi:hypothetical protein